MSRYDGLIIPRSYSEYINKTDAATLLQALQLSGVMDNAPTENSNKPAKSGGVFTALLDYLKKVQRGASNTLFSNNNCFGTKYTETSTWIPLLQILYEKDNVWNNAGFYKNKLCVANGTKQGAVLLQEIKSAYTLKKKTVTGTTNANGLIYKENSNIVGTEIPLFAKVTSANDYYVNIGYGIGVWLQIKSYNGTLLANTQVTCEMVYLEP